MLIYIEIFLIASIAWLIKLKLEHSNILDSSIDFQNGDCSSFTLIYGNLSSASTIFLGELHERTQETYDCIEQLTKRNILHTVYMEGIQSGIEAHCNSMISKDAPASRLASKPNRACIGWDFPEATKAIIKLSEENYLLSPIADNEEIVSNIQEIKKLHLFRNLYLAQTLFSKPKDRIGIVVVGKRHLVKDHEDDLGGSEQLRATLESEKHNNPYAILEMKTKNDITPSH